MTLDDATRHRSAQALRRAEAAAFPVEPLSRTYPALDVTDAYDVQLRNINARFGDGARLVGHKVGLTSAAMQELLGVDEPDFGHLLDEMVVADGASVVTAGLCAPRVEPEICFRLARTLRGPAVTVEDVLAATEAVAPALEIVDSRIKDWQITLEDTVADNASSAAVVHGPWAPLADGLDLAAVSVDLFVDGQSIARGDGGAVLGHPAAAVAWLANTLARFGTALKPGQIVLPGAMTTAPFVTAGQRFEAHFGSLGTVTVTFD